MGPVKGRNMDLPPGAFAPHKGKGGVRWPKSMTFKQILNSLGYASYEAYLRSPHWTDLRTRFMASKLFSDQCHACGDRTGLQLHHRTYKRFGFEWLEDMVMLCGSCHSEVHRFEKDHGPKLEAATQIVVYRRWSDRGVLSGGHPKGHPHFRPRRSQIRCQSQR